MFQKSATFYATRLWLQESESKYTIITILFPVLTIIHHPLGSIHNQAAFMHLTSQIKQKSNNGRTAPKSRISVLGLWRQWRVLYAGLEWCLPTRSWSQYIARYIPQQLCSNGLAASLVIDFTEKYFSINDFWRLHLSTIQHVWHVKITLTITKISLS